MTLLPDAVAAGVMTILLALLLAWVAVRNGSRAHGGLEMLAVSSALLVTGGGLGPPLIGALLAATWFASHRYRFPASGRLRLRLAHQWPTLLTVTTAAYLGLFPGTVVLHWWFGTSSAALVAVLGLAAFVGLSLTLVAVIAADRELAGREPAGHELAGSAGQEPRPTREARSRHQDSRSTRPS